jgi:uncharacterized protein (DUF58 family)
MEDYKKYLRPEVVAQMGNLGLTARLVVEGFITGLHKSPYHGFSVEFAQHRQYQIGDELKHIDWKIFGRTNRYYIKQYEDETNLRCTIIVDSSASMKYASKGHISKFEYASYIAASLAFMMMKQQDAAGLALYDTEVRTFLPSRSKQSYLQEILRALTSAELSNETGTASALDRLAEQIGRRGLVVIISDFFDDVESVVSALKHFRHKQHEVLAFQLLDPRERDFDFGYNATFKDMETGEELVTQPYQIQQAYKQTVAQFTDDIKRECRLRNIDYMLMDTSQSFDVALLEYLRKRKKISG